MLAREATLRWEPVDPRWCTIHHLVLQIDVNLVRKDEDYTAPARPKVNAFTGTGRKLVGERCALLCERSRGGGGLREGCDEGREQHDFDRAAKEHVPARLAMPAQFNPASRAFAG
jgi:hypothetical protein